MRIVSVNTAQTTGLHDIAFNMDGPLDSEVVRMAKMQNVTFTADGDVLRVRVSTEQPITATSIAVFNDALQHAETRKREDEAEAARRRERMLQIIQANTGLELK